MKSRDEILKSLSLCKEKFQSRYGISALALFGSYARGEQNKDSDVDVFVELDPSVGLDFVSLAEKIEAEIGMPTDVVSAGAIKPRYRKIIEADLIYV